MGINKAQVAILTPLELEYEAVVRHLIRRNELRFTNILYDVGDFLVRGERSIRVAVAQTGPKNSVLAQAAAEIIQRLEPEILLLVGVAGGVKDVKVGDVVVATSAYGYESGKETAEGFLSRPAVQPFNRELVTVARSVARASKWNDTATGAAPQVHFGPIASGDKVVATTESTVYRHLKAHYNDTLALEMEAIGFAQVVGQYPVVKALNIRGISDLLDHKSSSDAAGSQPLAAARAAAFAFALLAAFADSIAPLPLELPEPNLTGKEASSAQNLDQEASPKKPLVSVSIENHGEIEKVATFGEVTGNVSF